MQGITNNEQIIMKNEETKLKKTTSRNEKRSLN